MLRNSGRFRRSLAIKLFLGMALSLVMGACDSPTDPKASAPDTTAFVPSPVLITATSVATGCGIYLSLSTTPSGDPLLYPVINGHVGPILSGRVGKNDVDLWVDGCAMNVFRTYQRSPTYTVSGIYTQTNQSDVRLGEIATKVQVWSLFGYFDPNGNLYWTRGTNIFSMILPTEHANGGFSSNVTLTDTLQYGIQIGSMLKIPLVVMKTGASSRIDLANVVKIVGSQNDGMSNLPEQTVTITATPAPTSAAAKVITDPLLRPVRLSDLHKQVAN